MIKTKNIKKFVVLFMFIIILMNSCLYSCGIKTANAADEVSPLSYVSDENSDNEAKGDKTVSDAKNSSPQDNTPAEKNVLSDDGVIHITEKMYVTYINEIYLNRSDYIGKTIKIEGMYSTEEYLDNFYSYVYRIGPGCCGTDGSMCGLEFVYEGDMPKENDWIEVVGVLDTYMENGSEFLTIKAQSVIVMETRGEETVYQ